MATSKLKQQGLALQRRMTLWVVAVSTVLAGVFAGVAAATAPGHALVHRVVGGSSPSRSEQGESDDGLQTPAAPVQAPSQTSQPPVVSSGGS
jgi:hypothetical protein